MAVQLRSPLVSLNQFSNLEISKFGVGKKFKAIHTKPYCIKKVTIDECEAVLEHLRKFFFKDEPLNFAIKLIEFPNSRCAELEEYSLKSIKEGNSLMAVTPCGKIIGVCLNGVIAGDDSDEEGPEKCDNVKFAKILKILDYCGKAGTKAILQKYPDIGKVMFVKILSTDSEWRGMGIARDLLEYTRNIGRELGCSLMRVDCTSCFSAKAIAKIGFECIYELKYENYKKNGTPVFVTEFPHTAFTVYVQNIQKT